MLHPVIDTGGLVPPSKDIHKVHGGCQRRGPGSGSNIAQWDCVCFQNHGRRFLCYPSRRTATIASCAYMMVATYSPLPFWDGWIQVMYSAEGGNPLTLDWIWSQYNEHRMPIPKLFLLADLHWFHATQVFLLCSIFAILLLQLLVFAWMLRALGGWRGSLWRTGVGLAAFCLFCLSQWENLTWGMQVCFVLPGLFASLAFIGLLQYWTTNWQSPQSRHWGYLLLSIAGALGASWCYANGNLLWPILVVAALVLRLGLPAVLTYIVAGTLSTTLYLYGYIRPASNTSIGSIPATAKYLAAYFGSSWVKRAANTVSPNSLESSVSDWLSSLSWGCARTLKIGACSAFN